MQCIYRDAEVDGLSKRLASAQSCIIEGSLGVGRHTLLKAWIEREQLPDDQLVWVEETPTTDAASILDALAAAAQVSLGLSDDGDRRANALALALAAQGRQWVIWSHKLHVDQAWLEACARLNQAGAPHELRHIIICTGGLEEAEPPDGLALERLKLHAWDDETAHAALIKMAPKAYQREQDLAALAALSRLVDGHPASLAALAQQLRVLSPTQLLERIQTIHPSIDSIERATRASLEALSPMAREALMLGCQLFEGDWSIEALEALFEPALSEALRREVIARKLLTSDEAGAWRAPHYAFKQALRRIDDAEPAQRARALERYGRWLAQRSFTRYVEGVCDAWSPATQTLAPLSADLARVIEATWRGELALEAEIARLVLGLSVALKRSGQFRRLHAYHERLRTLELAPHPDELAAQTFIEVELLDLNDQSGLSFERLGALNEQLEARGWLTPELERLLTLKRVESANMAYEVEAGRALMARWLELSPHANPYERLIGQLAYGQAQTFIEHDYQGACARLSDAAQEAEASNWRSALAHAKMIWSCALQYVGDYEQSVQRALECTQLYEQLGRPDASAHALRISAWALVDAFRHTPARSQLLQLIELGRKHGIAWAPGVGSMLMGMSLLDEGEHAQAAIRFEQARYHLEREGDEDYLLATSLYEAINALLAPETQADGEAKLAALMARVDALPSRWGRIQIMSVALALHVKRDELEPARQLHETMAPWILEENSVLVIQHQLYGAIVWWREQQQAAARNELTRARELQGKLAQLWSALTQIGGEDDAPAWQQTLEFRLGLRLWLWTLSERERQQCALMVQDGEQRALLVSTTLRQLRAPGDPRWVEFPRRFLVWNLLLALIEAQAQGHALSADALCQRLWPQEYDPTESGALHGRLYVTINELRRDGLGDALVKTDAGYTLDERVAVIQRPNHEALWAWLSERQR